MATTAHPAGQQALQGPAAPTPATSTLSTSTPAIPANTPPGWSYNPSAWRERRWLIALAVIGLAAAIYTTLGQFGVVTLWDPFFGAHSSFLVTHSAIERLLPVPDGALGVLGYVADLVLGASGGADRWRRRPWLTLLFALTILGLGVVSLALTILQGVMVQQWCTVCLVSAATSTLIFGLGIGEALASLQLLACVHAEGRSIWQAVCGLLPDQRTPTPAIISAATNAAAPVYTPATNAERRQPMRLRPA